MFSFPFRIYRIRDVLPPTHSFLPQTHHMDVDSTTSMEEQQAENPATAWRRRFVTRAEWDEAFGERNSRLSRLEDNTHDIRARTDAARTAIDAARTAIDANRASIDAMEADLDSHNARLEADLDSHNARLDVHGANLDALRVQIPDILRQMSAWKRREGKRVVEDEESDQ
jgi:septal ring factor EnvC (AmiA/AmiB activator)